MPDAEAERDRTDERKEKRSGPISRNRIESLSDLIFGLALSVGALTLVAQPPTSPDEMSVRIIAFAFNFMVLIAIWIQYTTVMSRLPVETGRIVFANILLLLLIILMTYLINGIQFNNPPIPIPAPTALAAFSSQLYGLDLAGVAAIVAFLSNHLSLEKEHLLSQEYLQYARLTRNLLALFAVVFLITALPQMWDWKIAGQVPLRLALWWVPLIGTIWLNVTYFRNPPDRRE
ncbi:MAG: TMEM175 family protein [Nitrososphaerales archaeon]